ncbi:MAG: 50S ribosomal protein L4 [Thermoplasmatota archaeon]
MKVNIYNINGEAKGEINLPETFSEEIRPDIIQRAFQSSRANKRQKYGAKKRAGMRHSTEQQGKGQGQARVQRLKQGNNRAAESPQTVGGRKAHPPKAEKDLGKKINKKEKSKARRSALAATAVEEFIKGRGHKIENDTLDFPIIVEKGVEEITKTQEAVDFLKKMDIYSDIERAHEGKKIRAGKGKMRDRKYKKPVSLLVVLPEGSDGLNAFSNLAGVTAKTPERVTIDDLAPGGNPGRLTLFSVKSINMMEDW